MRDLLQRYPGLLLIVILAIIFLIVMGIVTVVWGLVSFLGLLMALSGLYVAVITRLKEQAAFILMGIGMSFLFVGRYLKLEILTFEQILSFLGI